MAKLFLFRRIKERFIRPINPMCEFYFINIVKLHVFYVPREICSLASFSSTFLLVSTKEHQRENIPPKFRDGNVFDSFFFFLFFFFTRNKIFSNLYDIFLSFGIAIAFDVRFLQTCFLFTYVYIYLCFELNHTVWITLGEISILRFVVKLEIQKNIVFLLFLMKTYVYMYVCIRVCIFQGTFKLLQRGTGKWIN